MASLTNFFSEFKKWLDGEEAAAIEKESPRVRREWEEFLISIAREIEVVLQREMFTPPGGPTYIPPEYLVFLSHADDAQWQGSKREGLERGLNYVLAERVKELIGEQEVQTPSFAVELRVDGTLEKGKFRVQPVWDISSPMTEIRPRSTKTPEPPRAVSASTQENEATIVRPRVPLLSILVTGENNATKTHHFHQLPIIIGRGSKEAPVDLQLEGDLEVSRKQAVIERLGNDAFVITCEGRNPIEVDGLEFQQGEYIEVKAGQTIKVGAFKLRISTLSESADRP